MRCRFQLYPTPSEKLYQDFNSKELTEVYVFSFQMLKQG